MSRRISIVSITLVLLMSACAKDGAAPPSQTAALVADCKRGRRDCRRGVHLRVPHDGELSNDVRPSHRSNRDWVHGRFQRAGAQDQATRTGVQRHRSSEQRHDVFLCLDRPAGTARRHHCPGDQKSLLLGAARRHVHAQLRLHRNPRNRRRGRQLCSRRPGLGRDQATQRKSRLPKRKQLRLLHHSNRGARPGRCRGRGSTSEAVPPDAAERVPRTLGHISRRRNHVSDVQSEAARGRPSSSTC